MAIKPNFGQIQPIALPPVQSVPVTQSLPARSGGGGDGGGANFNQIGSAFQEMARDQRAQEAHELNMQQGEQSLAFNAEMNPLKIEAQQQGNEAGGIAVEKARADWAQQKEGQNVIYQAVQNGEDPTKAYEGYLKNNSPDKYNSYREKAADTEKAIASVAKVQAETKQAQIETEKMLRQELAAHVIAIRGMGPLEMQEEMWKKDLSNIRKIHPTIPAKFDPKLLDYIIAQGAADYVPVSPEGKLAKDIDRMGGTKESINTVVQAKVDAAKQELNQKNFKTAQDMSQQFTNNTKDYVKVRDAYRRIQASGNEPSAAGDLSLIFNYMKMLDPGSVVREGEFATAQNTASWPETARAAYNKAVSGERLTDVVRKDFLSRSDKLMEAQQKGFDQIKDYYSETATRNGLNPKDVIVDLDLSKGEKNSSNLRQQADEAIKRGADPKAVEARYQELSKGSK